MAKIKKQKRNSEKPYNFYGIRKTRNPKYMSVSLVREDEDGAREWINVPVNIKNIRVKGDEIYLNLKYLSDDEDEDEDRVDYNEVARLKNTTKPTTKASRAKAMDIDDDSPF